MGTNVLYSIHRSVAANYIRGYTTEPVITEQSEKSITLSRAGTGSQPQKTFYNSAILIYTQQAGSTSLNAFLFGETAFDTYAQYSRNGTSWSTVSSTAYNTKTGDYYSSSRYSEYTVDGYTWASNFSQSVGDSGVTYELLVEGIPVFTDPDEYMNYITSPAVSYNWSSVPAISGKGKTISLPVLIDTDGNPVSSGSSSDFSTLPDNVKVRTLADLAVQ